MIAMNRTIHQLLIPPEKKRLADDIASQITNFIFSNQIKEGQKLPSERELADRLKVSRVVIREALKSLEQAGLVEIRPGQKGGAFVVHKLYKPFFHSIHDLFNEKKLTLQHFFETRKAIECFSIQLAAKNVTQEDIDKLRAINKRSLEDIEDNEKFRSHNETFHVAIAEMTGNPLIKLIVESLLKLLNTLYAQSSQSPEFIKNTYQRHEGIIKALKERKIKLCEKLMAIDAEYTKGDKQLIQTQGR